MVRMHPRELEILDEEVERLGKLCSPLAPMTRGTVLRLALHAFAATKPKPLWTSRSGPCRDSVQRWVDDWVSDLYDSDDEE